MYCLHLVVIVVITLSLWLRAIHFFLVYIKTLKDPPSTTHHSPPQLSQLPLIELREEIYGHCN